MTKATLNRLADKLAAKAEAMTVLPEDAYIPEGAAETVRALAMLVEAAALADERESLPAAQWDEEATDKLYKAMDTITQARQIADQIDQLTFDLRKALEAADRKLKQLEQCGEEAVR